MTVLIGNSLIFRVFLSARCWRVRPRGGGLNPPPPFFGSSEGLPSEGGELGRVALRSEVPDSLGTAGAFLESFLRKRALGMQVLRAVPPST
eukprot:1704343-Amphidinium_carterae.1